MKKVMVILTVMSTCIFLDSCQKSELTDPQNYLNEENSKSSNSAINKKNLSIGDYYQGGIIFYIDETGNHGLIVSTSDLGEAPWGCPGVLIDGTQWELGTGATNTKTILRKCSQVGTAADIVADLVVMDTVSGNKNNKGDGKKYQDWYLPSIDELYTLLIMVHESTDPVLVNLFPTGGYWTSVEGPEFWHVPVPLDPTVSAFSWYYYSKIDFPTSGPLFEPQPYSRTFINNVVAIRSF